MERSRSQGNYKTSAVIREDLRSRGMEGKALSSITRFEVLTPKRRF
jgi:hypothetical protein